MIKAKKQGGEFFVTIGGTRLSPVPGAMYQDDQTFAWGEDSPACKELALAIIDKIAGRYDARMWGERFAMEVLAKIKFDRWTLSEDSIIDWVFMTSHFRGYQYGWMVRPQELKTK